MNSYAVETDTKLANAHKRLADASTQLEWARNNVRRDAGQKRDRSGVWNDTALNAIAAAEASDSAWVKRNLNEYRDALHTVTEIKAEVEALNALYTGWSRFFLVTNTNGHIHRSMNCSTCYAETSYAWLPTLSGRTEDQAVSEQGEILCSVCFPSAPASWTTGVSRASQTARDDRAAKKAAADAKKAEKALGTVLRIGKWNDRIETIAAAKKWLTDAAEWGNESTDDIRTVALALASRLGTTPSEEIAAANKRAEKRNR